MREFPQGGEEACRPSSHPGRAPAEEARLSQDSTGTDIGPADEVELGLDQPEDEATEHALRLMDEALRRTDAGRRWLVAGDP